MSGGTVPFGNVSVKQNKLHCLKTCWLFTSPVGSSTLLSRDLSLHMTDRGNSFAFLSLSILSRTFAPGLFLWQLSLQNSSGMWAGLCLPLFQSGSVGPGILSHVCDYIWSYFMYILLCVVPGELLGWLWEGKKKEYEPICITSHRKLDRTKPENQRSAWQT